MKGTPVPDLSVTDLEGKSHAFRKGASDPTLLKFWGTWCGPCRQEMPELKKLFDRTSRGRFTILGVTSDESTETLRQYLTELSIAWPQSLESMDGPVHRSMRIDGIPAYFLISRNGTIIDRWLGSGTSIKRIEAAINSLNNSR